MTHTVGPKGQVVIPKGIRDELGIEPGSSVTFMLDGESVRVLPVRPDVSLRGRYTRSGMTGRLEADRLRERR